MRQKGIFEGAKHAFHKHVAPIGIYIGILILLSAGISVASATTITVNPGESIQAAIDLSSAGDIIKLAAGTHTPSDTILIDQRADITLRGTGATREDTLIQYATFPGYSAIRVNDSTGITLENFYINVDVSDGTWVPGSTDYGIYVTLGSDITISNIKVRKLESAIMVNGNYGTGPYWWTTENLTTNNCLFTRCRRGLYSLGLYNSAIKNTTINHNFNWMGIDLQGPCSNVLVASCTLHNNGNAGLKLYSGSSNHIIKDNLIYSNGDDGIWIMGGDNNQIINNTIRDNPYSGIIIKGPYRNRNNIIRNNRIYDNTRYGIECNLDDGYQYSGSQFIRSNTIYGNSMGGIWNNMINYDLTVKNNILAENGGYGISLSLGTITSTYNDIWANSAGDYTGTVLDKNGDVSDDPLFADPANGDFHLESTSPCIDAGDPNDSCTNEYPPINMGAYGNTIEASVSGNITPIPDDVYIGLEAEDTDTLTSDFEVANDASASNGEYMWIPEGTGWSPRKGEATYTIHINSTGDYVIWGTTLASTGGNNSFFVQIDTGSEALWAINISANWQWDAVNHWGNGTELNPEIDPVTFSLAAGEHTLKIKQREDGTKLDRLLITNNMSYVPAEIESTNALSGTVTSPCGTYIANATITLTTRAGAEINTTQTDSTGHYAFANVSPDYYDITATKLGYWSNTNNVTVTAGEPITADIVLCQKGDFNINSEPADAGDLAMMADATAAGTSDETYDLDGDGNPADEADLTLLKDVSVGVAELE